MSKWLVIQVQYENGALSTLGSWSVPEGDPTHVYVPDNKCAPLGWQVIACFMSTPSVRNMRIVAVDDPYANIPVPTEWAIAEGRPQSEVTP